MSSTQTLLNVIDRLCGVSLFQIPDACEEIMDATWQALYDLSREPDSPTLLRECSIIDRAVRAYYEDIVASTRKHMGSMAADNLYAMDAANEYYFAAGKLLSGLYEGFKRIPAAEDYLLCAAKSFNEHIVEYSMSYKSDYRLKTTQELTALIRRLDPSYRKPVKCISFFFWLAIVALAVMLLFGRTLGPFNPELESTRGIDRDMYEPYQGGVSCVLFGYVEAIALGVCACALKTGKQKLARISAIVPLGSRLACAITGPGFLFRLGYSGPAFCDLFEPDFTIPMQHITTLLNLLVLGLLVAYLFGKIPTTRKNLIAGVAYCLAATVGLVLFFFLSYDWPRHGEMSTLFAIASGTAAAGLIFAFPPAVDDY